MNNWIDIPGFEGFHQINNFGHVKALKSGRWHTTERILKPHRLKGYLYFHLYKEGKRTAFRGNRLVAFVFHGLDLNDPTQLACHRNDIRDDNRPENIFIGTAKENTQDMIRKGRWKGMLHGKTIVKFNHE